MSMYMDDQFTEKEKVAVILYPGFGQVIQRKSDGALFEASHPGYPDYSQLFGKTKWFFRRIEKLPRKWWWRQDRFKRTGEVWQTEEQGGSWIVAFPPY